MGLAETAGVVIRVVLSRIDVRFGKRSFFYGWRGRGVCVFVSCFFLFSWIELFLGSCEVVCGVIGVEGGFRR